MNSYGCSSVVSLGMDGFQEPRMDTEVEEEGDSGRHIQRENRREVRLCFEVWERKCEQRRTKGPVYVTNVSDKGD